MFWRVIQRDLKVAFRHRAEIIHPLSFFLMVITLFPLGVGPEPQLLAKIAGGVIWVSALLASLLSLDRLFKEDFHTGALEQCLLLPLPLPVWALGKILAHWLLTGVPLVLLSPLVALLFSLNLAEWQAMVISLLLGTPTLSLLGAVGAALTVGLKRGGVLLSLLVLPLVIPVLIFATAALHAASLSLPLGGYWALLAALGVASVTLVPFAVAAALRISLNQSE